MAGEIQLNSTSFASESGGTITINNATVGSAVAMSANQSCVKTALNASGDAEIYACRAWAVFNGDLVTNPASTTGIKDSGNVSTILDNGTNDYTVNFTNDMSTANYAVAGNAGQTDSGGNYKYFQVRSEAPTVSKFRISTYDSTTDQANHVSIAVFC